MMGSSRGGGGGIERVLSMKCSDTKYWTALNIDEEVPRLQLSAGDW